MTIMHDHITDLLNAGYSVTVEPDLGAARGLGPRRYFAHVEMDGDPDAGCTAEGSSPAEAIWAASPLHSDDEPMPNVADLIAEESEGLKGVLGIVRDAMPAPGLRDDVRTLSAEMSDVYDRVDALEADRAGHDQDMRLMIRALGDLVTRAFPDGLLATRGDGPTPAAGFTCRCGHHAAEHSNIVSGECLAGGCGCERLTPAPGMPSPDEGIPLCGKCGRYPVDHRDGACIYPRA